MTVSADRPLTHAGACGLLVIDKPAGMTSHDVVQECRRLLGTKRIGHTGTLDPDATGVLVLCLGAATRLAGYISANRKKYRADVVFGVCTDTQDMTGSVLQSTEASGVTEEAVEALARRFEGPVTQTPPMISARKQHGRRLYALAREGVTVERAPTNVYIESISVCAFTGGQHPVATLEVVCSSGTYIRALASDLGEAAGVGAAMGSLRRLWVGQPDGEFCIERAISLNRLKAAVCAGRHSELIRTMSCALVDWPTIRLSADQIGLLGHGRAVRSVTPAANEAHAPSGAPAGNLVAVLRDGGDLCAIGRLDGDMLRPVKVFDHHACH